MIEQIDITQIVAGNNDRTVFSPTKLRELADSIAAHGLIQPITVRELPTGETVPLFQIVAGERRYRAICLLGWQEIPCIVSDLTDEEAAAVMLAENVARDDLDPIDEALAYSARISSFSWTIVECAKKAGVSTIRVQFRLQLLDLRPELQKLIRDGQLGIGYAQIISRAKLDHNFQLIAMRELLNNSSPTIGWFRRLIGKLQNKQNQSPLFNSPIFGGGLEQPQQATKQADIPHPSSATPPIQGNGPKEIVSNQIMFWNRAAMMWHDIGKPFKRQECQAAAQALTFVLNTI